MSNKIFLKEPHKKQQEVLDNRRRFNVLACGRRWGKTDLGIILNIDTASRGQPAAWFAPTSKHFQEAWDRFIDVLYPVRDRISTNKSEGKIELDTGGRLDFWSLVRQTSGQSNVGRGRKYKRVVIDEASIAPYLEDDWTKAIRPTLTDLRGDAWFLSTPHGQNYFWQLWSKGDTDESNWRSWQLPTISNPFIHPDEISSARDELPADAFSQEYLAEFLADAANPFGVDAIRYCTMDELDDGPAVCWGADLAKSHDWTVLIGLNTNGNVCHFSRWQSDWKHVLQRLEHLIQDSPALIDSTGVGDPIVEQLQAKCSRVEGYHFSPKSKQQVMESLAVAIQNHSVRFPDGPIRRELEAFRYEYHNTGVRYEAPSGMHDDCVDALGLAVLAYNRAPRKYELNKDSITTVKSPRTHLQSLYG